jgi:carboxylesterase
MKQEIAHEARAEFLTGSKETGILVIHGFTGSTQSMRPVAYALHEKGYTVSLPCLKGHGTTPEDMETTGYKDWIASVTEAYNELKAQVKEVFVFGLSMGGALTLYSAINFEIKGAITVNAAIDLPEFAKLYNDPKVPEFIQGIGSDIKKSGIKEWAYDRTPKKCIGEIIKLTDILRTDLEKVTCPILIFSSLEDHVVPPYNQKYIFDHVGSKDKELIQLNESYHVATLDNDFNLIISKTLEFIEKNK